MPVTLPNQPLTRADVPGVMLLAGPEGIGKTSLAYSAGAFLIDADEGAHRAINRNTNTWRGSSWPEFRAEVTARATAGFDTIAIDTVERLLSCVIKPHVAAMDGCAKRDGELTPLGFGKMRRLFVDFVDDVTRVWRRNLLLIAHTKTVRISDRLEQTVPDIPGSSRAHVMRRADFIGYLAVNDAGSRTIQWDYVGNTLLAPKNPARWISPMRIPEGEAAATFLGELFAQGRSALAAKDEFRELAIASADAFLADVEAAQTAADYTRVWTRLVAFKRAAESEAARDRPQLLAIFDHVVDALRGATQLRGLRFDRERMVFTGTPAPVVQVPRVARTATRQVAMFAEVIQ